MRQGDDIFSEPPIIYTGSDNLTCKKQFAHFFKKEFDYNPWYYRMEDDFIIYKPNPHTKLLEVDVKKCREII